MLPLEQCIYEIPEQPIDSISSQTHLEGIIDNNAA